jgi:tungstate transport system permease protein
MFVSVERDRGKDAYRRLALELILTGDPALFAIVRLSLIVSLSAVAVAALLGVPLGAFIALTRFRGRESVVVCLNALMGLPPVVVGLVVYLLLSRSGPLGVLGILFTPLAMVIAQTILVTPIIAALARQTIEDLWAEYCDELSAMNVGPVGRVMTAPPSAFDISRLKTNARRQFV